MTKTGSEDTLGGRLRAARKARGWTLEKVEIHTNGIYKASILGAWERAERAISVRKLEGVAAVYGVTAASLLGDDSVDPTADSPDLIRACALLDALAIVMRVEVAT